jgi:hypothetical protein
MGEPKYNAPDVPTYEPPPPPEKPAPPPVKRDQDVQQEERDALKKKADRTGSLSTLLTQSGNQGRTRKKTLLGT